MKRNRLLTLLLPLLLLPAACQTAEMEETIADQDRQLEIARQERSRLEAERNRVRAQTAELRDQLAQAEAANRELSQRLSAMEAAQRAADAEVEDLRARLEGSGVNVSRRGEVIVLELPSAITFPSGSATLNDQGRKSLKQVAGILASDYAGKTFWIEGHTDNDPIKKSKWGSNLRLSIERAMAVADFLGKDLGIDPSALRVAGYGEWAPKVPNDSAENKAANRRVEILVLD
ncbi:MAG: hypothetical protein D6702_09655 [Planctomycetota bacterium]|nr:MAG: hypothetical protein D6702_09655 [Planctomycetota bacterium]